MQAGPRDRIFWGSVAVLLLIVLSISSYASFLRMVKQENIEKGKVQASKWTEAGKHPEKAKRMTILLIGVDNVQGSSRSDTLILGNVRPDDKKVSLLSIPRDTRVRLPERRGYDKITHAHVFGGVDLTVKAVEDVTGVPVDYYVKIDFEGFENIINKLGGIYMDVEKSMNYTDKAGGLTIDLEPGYQKLNGSAALGYVRFRHDAMGDIGRVGRQEKFLKAVMAQAMKPQNFFRLPGVIREVRKTVDTNLGLGQMLALGKVFKSVDAHAVEASILPGHPEYVGGVSYWLADDTQLRSEVNELFAAEEDTATVDVLNGSGVPGAARNLAERLKRAGFVIGEVKNAERMDYESTQLMDKTGNSEAVARIFEILDPKSTQYEMNLSPDGSDLVIIVGRDIKLLD